MEVQGTGRRGATDPRQVLELVAVAADELHAREGKRQREGPRARAGGEQREGPQARAGGEHEA
ncbi:MAG: hypothetical protein M3O70_03610, partial [Actinomycetota bacterium]|nr:hypothetical protein [Actinomycetota bacterium]